MARTTLQTFIDGKSVIAPRGWQDMTIKAAFGEAGLRPQIEIDSLEFAADGAIIIKDFFDGGNAFNRLPMTMVFKQGDLDDTVLNGSLDFSNGYTENLPQFKGTENNPLSVTVKFIQDDSISHFLDKISGVTYGSLLEDGIITESDYVTIKTAIVKRSSFLEVAMALVTIYLLQNQLQDAVKSIKDTVKTIASLTASGGATGGLGAVLFAVATLLIQVAYAVALVALLFKLITQMISLLLPPILKNKGMSYKTLLTKACEKFDLGFNSNITQLDTYHYLPSKPFSNEKDIIKDLVPQYVANKVGIPSTGDYGYIISEMFDLMNKEFRTKLEVVNGVVQLHNVDDPYWKTLSSFKPHIPLFFNTKKYNTEDLKQTRITTFLTDVNDSWTLENYTGTSYEVKTNSATEGTIKGLDRNDIPLALGSSKTKANIVETLVISMASIADAFAKVIGQDTGFQESIEANRINVLKISSNEMSVPKVIPLIGGNMPPNHRDLLSAKFLDTTFHSGKSFVTGDQLGQKVIYDDFQQPFNLNDFLNVTKSGKFTMTDGREANFIDMEYNISKDICDCSIYVQEVYTNKLTETTYEP